VHEPLPLAGGVVQVDLSVDCGYMQMLNNLVHNFLGSTDLVALQVEFGHYSVSGVYVSQS
jgi:hypothetical protein